MATALPHNASSLRLLQCLIEIPKYIVQRFESDRQPNHLRCHARSSLLVLVQLAMRRGRRMNHERLRIADVRKVREELHALDEALAGLGAAGIAAPDAERENSARAARQVAARERLV